MGNRSDFWIKNGVLTGYVGDGGEVEIPDDVTEIGEAAFAKESFRQFMGDVTSVFIPDGVTSIGARAFAGCTELTELRIPDSVTAIGEQVFSGCRMLCSIKLPKNLESIGEEAFKDCKCLAEINLPQSLTSVGKDAFSFCSRLPADVSERAEDLTDELLGPELLEELSAAILSSGNKELIDLFNKWRAAATL